MRPLFLLDGCFPFLGLSGKLLISGMRIAYYGIQ